MEEPISPTTLKQRLRSSLCLIPACLVPKGSHHHNHNRQRAVTAPTTPQGSTARDLSFVRTSSFSSSGKTTPSSPSSSRHHHHHQRFQHHSHSHSNSNSQHHHHNHHHEFAELRDKCKSFIGRIGRHGHHGGGSGRRHSASADFKYDALSYALNFDHEETNPDDFPLRSFSSRLPLSPPRSSRDSSTATAASPAASASNEITAYS